jgi:transcriptional regulator with XRE-family HTH domain
VDAQSRLRKTLGNNILAVLKGRSVAAFAELAGVSVAHLYDVIDGRKAATIDFVGKVAAALDIPPSELLVERDAAEVRKAKRRR